MSRRDAFSMTLTMKRLVLVLALASLAAPAFARMRAVRHPAEACAFALVPEWTGSVPAAGITRGVVLVLGQTASCAQWSAYSQVDWVIVEAAPLDAQPAAYVTVAPNTNPEGRITTLVIAGVRIDVMQEGAPAIANPRSLVTNGSLHTNIDGWIWYDGRFPNGRGNASWSPLDANGSPASGSILMRDDGIGLAFQRLQCLPVTRSTQYRFGAKVRTGAAKSRGDGTIALFTYPSPDCTGEFTDNETRLLSPAEPHVWQEYAFVMRTGSRTQSMILVIASGAFTPPFETWFDDVFVEPVE